MIADTIFGREADLDRLRQMLSKRRSFLLYGPTGVGKSLLVQQLASETPNMLYCRESTTPQVILRTLAAELLQRRAERVIKAFRRPEQIKEKSIVSLKGVIVDALAEGEYWIVLDHLRCPSQSLASNVKELANWGSTPVLAIARSAHMEDIGFLRPMFSDRSEKCLLSHFDRDAALLFARSFALSIRLSAANERDFLDKVVRYSEGNPGAIATMLNMANSPKYRTANQIKTSPLYIDFRLRWEASDG